MSGGWNRLQIRVVLSTCMRRTFGRLESTPDPRCAEHLHALIFGRLDSALSEDLREIIYGRRDLRER